MSQKRSRDEIIKDFDTAAAKAVKDNPRLAREMKINRKQLGQMKVGMFRVLALDAFSDFTELIFDGHHIFQLNAWGGVEIYSRVKY